VYEWVPVNLPLEVTLGGPASHLGGVEILWSLLATGTVSYEL